MPGIASKTVRVGDCLIWQGGTDHLSRPRVKINGKAIRVARHLWEQANGPIPAGLALVNAQCGDKACVEPDHHRLRDKNAAKGARSAPTPAVPEWLTPEPWKASAACRDAEPSLFVGAPVDDAAALKFCASCPVRSQCGAWAERVKLKDAIAGGARV